MEWSPTRRELLATAGVGLTGVGLTGGRPTGGKAMGSAPAAGFGNVSLRNATDAVPDHPFVPEATVRWNLDVGEAAIPVAVAPDSVFAVIPEAVTRISTDGTPRWRYEVETREQSDFPRATVAFGTVYANNDESVRALDAETGTARWRYDGERYLNVRDATPDTVLVDGADGIVALSATDGRERWHFTPETGGVWFGTTLADGTVYVGTTHGRLYALAESDGGVRWRIEFSEEDGNEYRTEYPHIEVLGRVGDLVLAYNAGEGVLYGLSSASGRRRWTTRTGVDSRGFPGTVDGGTVYLNDGSVLMAISATDGTDEWRYDFGRELDWTPTVVGDAVYASGVGGIAAVERDGTERWRFDTGDDVNALAVGTVGDAIVVHSHEAALYALAPTDGRLRWKYAYPENVTWFPQTADDTAYFATESGTVYALSSPGSTPLYDALRTAASPPGLALGGLLAGGLLAEGYRRRKRAQAPPPDPEEFADFEIWELLGESDCAETYEATTPAGERVAMKRFESDAIDPDAFSEAVETWTDLDAPGVLEVRQWGLDPAPWVATERWDATLAERTADSSSADLAPREIVHAVADAAETVHRVHREEVVHGGLTAETVVFVDGEVRVRDWRLAADLRGSVGDSDAHQLASMADDLLGDEESFSGMDDERAAKLDEVLSRALSPGSDERYDSALDLADALRWAVRE